MQTPERDRRQRRTSSLTCTLPQTHATRRAYESTNVAAGCSCGSPGYLSSRFSFLPVLSGRAVTATHDYPYSTRQRPVSENATTRLVICIPIVPAFLHSLGSDCAYVW